MKKALYKSKKMSVLALLLLGAYPAVSLLGASSPSVSLTPPVKMFDTYATFYQKAQSKLEHIFQLDPSENSERIRLFSSLFKDVPYVRNRLIGSSTTEEQLVIDFGALDCFTYLDYVEALRKSNDLNEFRQKLIETRYVKNDVSYLTRRHFFSDWVSEDAPNAQDVTGTLTDETQLVSKTLNQAKDGKVYITGLHPKERDITYIPADKINDNVISNLQDGDYIGIYTPIEGLDVTHTGLFINTPDGPMLRNASSKSIYMKVVDSPFIEYVKDTPGIVVYRAIDRS